MKIIAFGHRRRTGKNLAADFLFSCIKARDPKIKIFKGGFADAVKDHAHHMFAWAGLHPGYYYDNNSEEKEKPLFALGKSPRDIWIHVGEKMREICPKLWVHLFFEKVPADIDIVIIYDLRKIPESEEVLARGGQCFRMIRNVEEFSDPVDSELRDWDKWSGTINNTGTKRDLMAKMSHFAEMIFNG